MRGWYYLEDGGHHGGGQILCLHRWEGLGAAVAQVGGVLTLKLSAIIVLMK